MFKVNNNFIVNFEHISHLVPVVLLLILSRKMAAGSKKSTRTNFYFLNLGRHLPEEHSSVETSIENRINTWNKETPKKLYKEYKHVNQFYRPHK